MFITFEGIEGCGKSTQLNKCIDFLKKKKKPCISTKEPGATSIGSKIREILLNPNSQFKNSYTELLLFYADRYEHISQVIKPALEQNKIVCCDRFIDSTIAYQHYGRGLSIDTIHHLNNQIDCLPSLTFLFDCKPETGLKRAKKRASLDRFEKESILFHKKIREGFFELEKKFPTRIIILSTENRSIDTIHNDVISILKNKGIV